MLPWIEKYRPQKLEDIVYHDHIVTILRNFIKTGSSIPHLFLYGSAGTGKTSTVLTCAKEMFGAHMSFMVLHLNASDDRDVDVVRRRVISFASTNNLFSLSLPKLVILDEADSMTEDAQNALKDVMVRVGDNVRFCFIGNFQYCLVPTLKSRLVKLVFMPIPFENAKPVIARIVQEEGLTVDETTLNFLYVSCEGDLRKFINVLQVLAVYENGMITLEMAQRSFFNDSDTRLEELYATLNLPGMSTKERFDTLNQFLCDSHSPLIYFFCRFTEYVLDRLPVERIQTFLGSCTNVILGTCQVLDTTLQLTCFAMILTEVFSSV